ncbi:MAG: proline dehydrogenase family protein [Nitrososphaerales archaeon]
MKPKGSSKKAKPALFEKLVQRMAKKWVAGYSLDDALKSAKETNAKGMRAIINYLGEHVIDDNEIEANVKEYIRVLQEMDRSHINGSITPKLTQIGLDKDYETCENNALMIVKHAKKMHKFVWLDMESSSYINDTINIYLTLLKHYEMVGLAFQAYLKQGTNYLNKILTHNGKVRLVKGAYREDSSTVFRSKRMVDKNYMKLMRMLFEDSNGFAIATHDNAIIDSAVKLYDKYQKQFQFQMLKGIRDDIKPSLLRKGFSLAEYIPYGENVAAYSVRRLREKPSNILLLARSLF